MDRRVLVQGKMSPHTVVVVGIRSENLAQVPFAERDDVIEALAADRADEASYMSVLPRQPPGNQLITDSHSGETLPGGVPVNTVTVSEQISRCLLPGEGFGDLPRNPLGCGMRSDCHSENAPGRMVQDHEPIEEPEADRRHDEEIHRGDAGGVVAQEGLPALARWASALATVDCATSTPSFSSSP